MRIEYGDGKINTQQGTTVEGYPCLMLTKMKEARPVGSKAKHWEPVRSEEDIDVLLVFKTIESARVLQDELNELIAIFARENALKVD